MVDLKLDFDELNSLKSKMDTVSSGFSRAERISEDVAGYTGHDRLAGKVREFANNWDIGRGKLQANLDYVSEAMKSIVDTFTDLDQRLADTAGRLAPTVPASEAPTAGTDPAPTGSVPAPSGSDPGSTPGSVGGEPGGPGVGGEPGGGSGVPDGESEGPGTGVPGSEFTPNDPGSDGIAPVPFPRPEFELATDPAIDSYPGRGGDDGASGGEPPVYEANPPEVDFPGGSPSGEPPIFEANPPRVDLPGGFPDTGGSPDPNGSLVVGGTPDGGQPVTEGPGALPGDASSSVGESAAESDSSSGGAGGSGSGGGGSASASFPEGVPTDPAAAEPLAAADGSSAPAGADDVSPDGDIRAVVADRLSGESAALQVGEAEQTDTSGVPVEAAAIAGGAGLAAAGLAAAGVAGASGLRTRTTTTGDER